MAGVHVKVNGMAAVIERTTDPIGFKFAQEDGTVGQTTAIGVHAKGPSVLKLSARLLKMSSPQEFRGAIFEKHVTPEGIIKWIEIVPSPELAGSEFNFFRDEFTLIGAQLTQEFNRYLESFFVV